jgi:hypothetical protein
MKVLGISVLLAGSALLAQQQPGGGGFGRMINPGGVPSGPGGVGFGRLIYPGTGGPGNVNVAPVISRAPRGGQGFVPLPRVSHPQNHERGIIVPYPVFYGDYYFGYDAPPAPNVGGYYSDQYGARQEAPVVIINQNFVPDTAQPSYQDYSNAPLPPPQTLRRPSQPSQGPAPQTQAQVQVQDDQPSVYLIALKDHTIYAAIGYWTEDQTLHYITQENVHNRIGMDQVDRAFTKQLNDERHIDMRLPPEP